MLFWLILFFPILTWAGGSFSGGEDGVVCFADSKTAAEAVDEFGYLKSEYKKIVRKVYAAEYWEGAAPENRCNLGINFKNYKTGSGWATVPAIIDDALSGLRAFRPNLAVRLDSIQTLIAVKDWVPLSSVALVDDSSIRESDGPECRHSLVPKSSNCRVVQLARRDQIGEKLYIISFDAELHKKLDPLNRAIVELHERVYLLGSLLEHRRSESTRYLVMTLFNEQTTLDTARSLGVALLAGGFGLYTDVIDLLPLTPLRLSEDSRIRSYQQFYYILLEWANRRSISVYKSLTTYFPELLSTLFDDGRGTDEMAFMINASLSSPRFDDLIDRQPDESFAWSENGRKVTALEYACNKARQDYIVSFDALVALIGIGQGHRWKIRQWRKVRDLIEKNAKGQLLSENLCALVSAGTGPEAARFSQRCFLRQRSIRYCESLKSGYRN